MFGQKQKYQVLVPENGLEKNAAILKAIGVRIFDLRETDMRTTADNSIIAKIYILRCESTKKILDRIKEQFTSERMYEGYRTFY